MSIVEEVKDAMHEAELAFLDETSESRTTWMRLGGDVYLRTPLFGWRGFQANVRPLLLIPCYALGLVVYLYLISFFFGESQSAWSTICASIFLSAGLVTFLLPSRSATRAVDVKSVDRFAKYLASLQRHKRVSLLAAIALVRARSLERVQRMMWTLGVGWAAATWFVSNAVLSEQIPAYARSIHAGQAFGGLLLLVIVGIAVSSYATAIRLLYQTIDLAFIQVTEASHE
ncbi:hypothetical protein [Rhodanobacter sp. L36]|uniref:hypothetical protein n=1 Tax=Rhodanobacter sp. L36 TaxID=1747221 RepID=UPI00131DB007|nr:hypothetical protein [Rhodanobacter sp. L36]